MIFGGRGAWGGMGEEGGHRSLIWPSETGEYPTALPVMEGNKPIKTLSKEACESGTTNWEALFEEYF